MARTKGSTGETTKPRIREAAARLMAAHGYDGLTMRGIGAEVGLQAGAIYRYFPDKASLASDLVAEASAGRDQAFPAIDRSGKPLDVMEKFTASYLAWRMGADGAARMIDLCVPALGAQGDALEAASLDPEAEMETILAAGQEDGSFRLPDARATALSALAMLDALAADTRLPEDRRARIGWSFVRRLVKA